MIIDCHCHAGKGDGLTGPWDTSAPIAKYLGRAEAAGITHAVLFAAFHSNYSAANKEVARIVAQNRKRFMGLAFVHAERDRGHIHKMVELAVQGYGFVGIKVHRHDARLSREICDAAKSHCIPVLYDPMGEVSIVELLAQEYPDVDFIIPHLGSFSDDWKAQHAMIDYLVRHPNIYTDTSGIRRFDLLEDACSRAGPHKILFGSDGPWLHPGVELSKVYALKLPAPQRQMVLAGNFLRLISKRQTRPKKSFNRTDVLTHDRPTPRDPWLNQEMLL